MDSKGQILSVLCALAVHTASGFAPASFIQLRTLAHRAWACPALPTQRDRGQGMGARIGYCQMMLSGEESIAGLGAFLDASPTPYQVGDSYSNAGCISHKVDFLSDHLHF